jgi:hypothetical protein
VRLQIRAESGHGAQLVIRVGLTKAEPPTELAAGDWLGCDCAEIERRSSSSEITNSRGKGCNIALLPLRDGSSPRALRDEPTATRGERGFRGVFSLPLDRRQICRSAWTGRREANSGQARPRGRQNKQIFLRKHAQAEAKILFRKAGNRGLASARLFFFESPC